MHKAAFTVAIQDYFSRLAIHLAERVLESHNMH